VEKGKTLILSESHIKSSLLCQVKQKWEKQQKGKDEGE